MDFAAFFFCSSFSKSSKAARISMVRQRLQATLFRGRGGRDKEWIDSRVRVEFCNYWADLCSVGDRVSWTKEAGELPVDE